MFEKIQDKNFLKRKTILELHILHMDSLDFHGNFLMLGFVLNSGKQKTSGIHIIFLSHLSENQHLQFRMYFLEMYFLLKRVFPVASL